jgi:hypothetical protein
MVRGEASPFYEGEGFRFQPIIPEASPEGLAAVKIVFLADRMEEGYRQHHMAVRPKLKRPIRETIFSQVYASFQHDKSAVAAATYMGYHNVMWGSDYPHMEGTFGHTQETLHELFDDADPKVAERVMRGAFYELFPGVPPVLGARAQ